MQRLIAGLVILCGVIVVLLVSFHYYRLAHVQSTPETSVPQNGQPMLPTTQIKIGNTTIAAELATTPQEQADGLSDRTLLANGTGMLFVFNPPQSPGFWMKEMLFSLDIIYATADGTIVTIYPDLAPSTYPQVYYPDTLVKYVLEVPAGFAAAHGVAVGDRMVVQ